MVTATKGMKYRVVPMTRRLHRALTAHRHLRGPRVLYTDAGETVTAKVLQKWMVRAQHRAGLRATGALHIMRHTFCSHLAMARGHGDQYSAAGRTREHADHPELHAPGQGRDRACHPPAG